MGNFTEAIRIRKRTLAEYEKILEGSDASEIKRMANLAENYVAVKNYSDAIKLCDKAFELQNAIYTDNVVRNYYPGNAELIHIKAKAQSFLGDDVNAYNNYKTLIQIYETRRTAQSYTEFSNVKNKSQWFAGIVPIYKEAATAAAKVGDMEFAFYCMEFCKARSLIDRFDDVLVAKEHLLTPSDKERIFIYDELLKSSQEVVEYANTINDERFIFSSEAFHAILYLQAEELKDDLRKKYSDNKTPKDSNEQRKLRPALESFEWVNTFGWDDILKNFDAKKNQAAIPDGACLIEFMKTSDDSLLVTFLRNEGEIQSVNIPVDKQFFDDCRLYRDLNAYYSVELMRGDGKYIWNNDGNFEVTSEREHRNPKAFSIEDDATFYELRKNISDKLSKKLMPVLEKFAQTSSHWIISPDAELNFLPFETLNYHDKFLIESKDLSYVPSLAVLNLMRDRERKNSNLGSRKDFFAMGNAVYGNSDLVTVRRNNQNFFTRLRGGYGGKIDLTSLRWIDLKGTAHELDKVSPLFESKTIFRREQANEKILRELNASGELSKYKYLLFATHGMFIPERPEFNSIVLSQQLNDGQNDGYITVGEWMGYNLQSNLVYLSACESGLGHYQAGEGIVGIPYALTVAGNKNTVMSLWKVYDAATAEFTSAVFEKLSRGQSEVSALNETKREFLRQDNPIYRSPSVWAAFILYGI